METPATPHFEDSDDKHTNDSPTNEDSIDNLGDPDTDGQFQREVSAEDDNDDSEGTNAK